jgi:hypothetical protein
MLGKMFPSWVERTVNDTDVYTGATFVALLLKSSYTFDSTDVFIADLTPASNEVVGGNYVRKTPTGLSISRTGSATTVLFNPIVFPTLTLTGSNAPRSMILARALGTDAISPLVLQQDFEIASDVNGADVTLTPSPSGFIRYVSSP